MRWYSPVLHEMPRSSSSSILCTALLSCAENKIARSQPIALKAVSKSTRAVLNLALVDSHFALCYTFQLFRTLIVAALIR
jgi:hypothetical protein